MEEPAADHATFREEEFVRQLTAHQPALQAFIAALMPGDPAVDNVLQATNITLWRKRAEFDPGSHFRAWAFACARGCACAHFKDRGRSNWLVFDDELAETIGERMAARLPTTPDTAQAALRHCLARLRDHDRQLLLSHYEAGESLAECAHRTGRSVTSLKDTLFRLRAALRRCISERLTVEIARSP